MPRMPSSRSFTHTMTGRWKKRSSFATGMGVPAAMACRTRDMLVGEAVLKKARYGALSAEVAAGVSRNWKSMLRVEVRAGRFGVQS